MPWGRPRSRSRQRSVASTSPTPARDLSAQALRLRAGSARMQRGSASAGSIDEPCFLEHDWVLDADADVDVDADLPFESHDLPNRRFGGRADDELRR